MNITVEKCVQNLKLGKKQSFQDLVVFPVLESDNGGPDYLTLEEAVEARLITVTEVDESGSVPRLKVVIRADKPVMLLDGEELQGAKQNRVLNTTVLLAPHSTTVVPVSCTEQGRWSYDTEEFAPSEHVMDYKIRQKKTGSVSRSLREHHSFASDQGEVWDEIACFSRAANVHSPTGAMRDVFEHRKKDYDECLRTFPVVEGQVGLVAFVNGRPAGLDVISNARAYRRLHDKLLKSYASDAITRRSRKAPEMDEENVREFVRRITACEETGHGAVSLGEDYRYSSRQVCGSALVFEGTCIHGAFFADEAQAGEDSRMSSFSQRRSYRRHHNN